MNLWKDTITTVLWHVYDYSIVYCLFVVLDGQTLTQTCLYVWYVYCVRLQSHLNNLFRLNSKRAIHFTWWGHWQISRALRNIEEGYQMDGAAALSYQTRKWGDWGVCLFGCWRKQAFPVVATRGHTWADCAKEPEGRPCPGTDVFSEGRDGAHTHLTPTPSQLPVSTIEQVKVATIVSHGRV